MTQTPHESADVNSELLWLLGQPHLDEYLGFVRTKVVGGGAMPPRKLATEWRAANDRYHDLQTTEAGAADGAECLALPAAMKPLAAALRRDPYFRRAFDTLPTTIAMVEVDKLIVSQTHIANVFSDARARDLGSSPTAEALFRFCLPMKRETAPVRVRRLEANRYLFTSASTDFRAHDPKLLGRELLARIGSYGPIAGGIGLTVGFGSNFMSAIRSEGRLVLHNGYHRAHTLRSLGVTHAPCIVETVTRTQELRLTAGDAVSDDPALYYRSPRPPLLRDFFDPALVKRLRVRPMETMIEVEFKMRSWTTTDMTDPDLAS